MGWAVAGSECLEGGLGRSRGAVRWRPHVYTYIGSKRRHSHDGKFTPKHITLNLFTLKQEKVLQ